MKMRSGFVGNSSSSSFVFTIDNNQLEKFERCLFQYNITYEELTILRNISDVCCVLKNGLYVSVWNTFDYFYYNEKTQDLEFVQFTKSKWEKMIKDEISLIENKIAEIKTEEKNCFYHDNQYLNYLINQNEKLKIMEKNDPNDLTFRNRITDSQIRSEFDTLKKEINEMRSIVIIALRRDGSCPASKIESELCDWKNLKTFLNSNEINIKNVGE